MARYDLRSENLISLPRIFGTLLMIGFTAETVVMFLLPVLLPRASDGWGAFADATLLTLISAPAIWYLVIRPLRRAALREKEQAAAVIAHAVDAIMTLDAQGTILSCNAAGESIFGYAAHEMVGQPLTLLIPELPDARERAVARTFSDQLVVEFGGSNVAHGYVGRKKDGSGVPIELSGSVVRLDRRKTLIAIVRDVTERRRVEEQLQKLNRPTATDSNFIVPPAEVIGRLNLMFPMKANSAQFATLLYGVLDTENGLFRYTSAGHPGPIVVEPSQVFAISSSQGLPIGVSEDAVYTEECIRLELGTRITLFTDGLIEQTSRLGELFGSERLVDAIEKLKTVPIGEFVSELERDLLAWGGTDRLSDDLSILAFERVDLKPG